MIDFTRLAFLIAGLFWAFVAQSRANEILTDRCSPAVACSPACDAHWCDRGGS